MRKRLILLFFCALSALVSGCAVADNTMSMMGYVPDKKSAAVPVVPKVEPAPIVEQKVAQSESQPVAEQFAPKGAVAACPTCSTSPQQYPQPYAAQQYPQQAYQGYYAAPQPQLVQSEPKIIYKKVERTLQYNGGANTQLSE